MATVLCGCATTYKPAENIQTLQERVSQQVKIDLSVTCNDVKVHCFPIIDQRMAETNLGILPEEFEVLPIFLKVENTSQNPIKVDLPNSFMTVGEKQNAYIDTDSAVERIGKNDTNAAMAFGVMFGVLGGAVGGIAGAGLGSAIDSSKVGSGTIEGHYHRQSFTPTFIYPNNSGAGLVFYHVSKEDLDSEKLTLILPIVDLNTKTISNAEITFKPGDFGRIKGDKQ
jgi:hypothetical protein